MKLIVRKAPLFIATLMLLSAAAAVAATGKEPAQPAPAAEPGVVVKVGKAIEHGVKAGASGVERGAKAAGRGIEHGAKAAARGVERGAKATGNAARAVAGKVGGSSHASSSTGK